MDRQKLWRVLSRHCLVGSESDNTLAMLIIKMYQESEVIIGKHSLSADLDVVQGGVLSPMLFNIYLEEALGTTSKLREMVSKGDLLVFADDMLIMTNSKPEMT